jgi:hypothetical protein
MNSVVASSAVIAATKNDQDDEDDEKGVGIHGNLLAKQQLSKRKFRTRRVTL